MYTQKRRQMSLLQCLNGVGSLQESCWNNLSKYYNSWQTSGMTASLCSFTNENVGLQQRAFWGVEMGEKLSTPKKPNKMVKVTYTLTYPHYPHVFYVNYGELIMVTYGTDVLWSCNKNRFLVKNVEFWLDFFEVKNKWKFCKIVAKHEWNVV